jgi:hypothetical protein
MVIDEQIDGNIRKKKKPPKGGDKDIEKNNYCITNIFFINVNGTKSNRHQGCRQRETARSRNGREGEVGTPGRRNGRRRLRTRIILRIFEV